MSLDNFAFVLFQPKSPGNIGAAARALKNMGLRDLRIVSGTSFGSANGGLDTALAVHARDLLATARTYPQLESALEDRTLVVGTTARAGLYRSEARPVREMAIELAALGAANRIALVFGPEDCGLTNEELKLCQRLITIPTALEYASLNLAQAVMVVAYELMLAAGAARQIQIAQHWARVSEVNAMLSRMAKALMAIGFLPEDNPDHIMFTLRAILGRAGLRPRELNILNGIVSQIMWFAESGHETLAAKRRAGKKLR
jgi:tRNA/rRNA methyltransferase